MGTCQGDNGYLEEWQAEFGNAMRDINGANVDTGIECNFEATCHLRHSTSEEKLTLRRRAYLERIGTDVWYRDAQGQQVLVGRKHASLKAFLQVHFTKNTTINEALLSAQIALASRKGKGKSAEASAILNVGHDCRQRDLRQDIGQGHRLCQNFAHDVSCCPRVLGYLYRTLARSCRCRKNAGGGSCCGRYTRG